VVEALFLAGVAAAVTVAELRAAAVIVVMALAWAVVALIEWTSWLDEPHYGRGLPPRYYVPQVALPPPRAVEQPGHYPLILEPDDEPTFVASVTEWATALEDWPVTQAADEPTQIAYPDEDLDDLLELEAEPELEPAPQPELEPEPELPPEPEPAPELPREIELPPVLEELFDAGPLLEDDPTPVDGQMLRAEPEPFVEVAPPAGPEEREAEEEPPPEQPTPVLVPVERPALTATHHLDPLAVAARRRRLFGRADEEHVVEVPDGPPAGRRLPAPARRVRQER
jgi:hypothetical protein